VFLSLGRRYCFATRDMHVIASSWSLISLLFSSGVRSFGSQTSRYTTALFSLVSLGSQAAELCHGLAHFDVYYWLRTRTWKVLRHV